MKKKLLHISLGSHNKEMWNSFDRHFETVHIDWTILQNNPEELNSEVRKLFDSFNPDVVFMQLQQEGVIDVFTATYMSKSSIVLNWTGDVRFPIPDWYKKIGRCIDITLFSNMNDVDTFNSIGINANFLQVGFDENIFNPDGELHSHYPDIVFLGTNYLNEFPLSSFRIQMVKKLKEVYGRDFMVYGSNWKKIIGTEQFLHPIQEAEAYRSSKISINLSHFNYGRYSSDRMLRMMGSGGFCLSHHFTDIEKDYKIGKHIDTWTGIDSLIDKIEYYLDYDEAREKIRKEGCNFVRENYTWDKVMLELKKIIGIE